MAKLAEAVLSPLRVGATPATLKLLFGEPMLFAAHYAVVSEFIHLPEEIEAVLATVRTSYDAHDAVLDLIGTLRKQVSVALSTELARGIAEGLELHTTLRLAPETYRQACADALTDQRRALDKEAAPNESAPDGRLTLLTDLLAFSEAQTQVLAYAVAYMAVPALQLFTRLFSAQRWNRPLFWHTLLDLDAEALSEALSAKGRLAGSGLLYAADSIPNVSEFWVELLFDSDRRLEDSLVQTLALKDTPGGAARLPAEDQEILRALLSRREPGINVLVHGKAAVDKQRLAQGLIQAIDGRAYTLVGEIPERDQPAAVMVAQRLLAWKPGPVILVVEKAQEVLTRSLPDIFTLLGLSDGDAEARPLDERILAENPVPTLWLVHESRSLHRDTLTRFLFHAEALKGTRADRMALVESIIESLPLAKSHKTELAKLEGLSAQQLACARTLATMTAGRSRKTFARHLLVATTRSQKALARREKDQARIPVTRYSLDYIHSVRISRDRDR